MAVQLQLRLKPIDKSDYRFLYGLLLNRDPIANVSHKKNPSFKDHVKFVNSKPYSKWYIIMEKNKKAGSIYLSKQNEIGIFIKKDFQKKGIGKTAVELLMKKNPSSRFLANVSPKNNNSKKFFKKMGFELIQYTYELTT